MIKSLTIKNWQSWQDTHIEFDGGLNVLMGISDSGKSAIIRAIEWLILNKAPKGSADSFIHDGENECYVEAEFDNCTVGRRTGKKNEYTLTIKGKTQSFTAFNRTIPEEIQTAISMDYINFTSQHDATFLFSNTSGEVAKLLNEVVDLNIIDETTLNINRMVKDHNDEVVAAKSAMQVSRDNISDAEKYLESFESDVLKFNELYTEHTKLKKDIVGIEDKIDSVGKIDNQLECLDIELEGLADYKTVSPKVDRFHKLLQERKEKLRETKELYSLISEFQDYETRIEDEMGELEYVSGELVALKEELKELQSGTCPLCGKE